MEFVPSFKGLFATDGVPMLWFDLVMEDRGNSVERFVISVPTMDWIKVAKVIDILKSHPDTTKCYNTYGGVCGRDGHLISMHFNWSLLEVHMHRLEKVLSSEDSSNWKDLCNIVKLDQSMRVKMARFTDDNMTVCHEGRFFICVKASLRGELTGIWVDVTPY